MQLERSAGTRPEEPCDLAKKLRLYSVGWNKGGCEQKSTLIRLGGWKDQVVWRFRAGGGAWEGGKPGPV